MGGGRLANVEAGRSGLLVLRAVVMGRNQGQDSSQMVSRLEMMIQSWIQVHYLSLKKPGN